MNLQNIIKDIDNLIKDAKKEQRRSQHTIDVELAFWEGYEQALLMVKVRILNKIKAKLERKNKQRATVKEE